MNDRERREMEARTLLWGDLVSGPIAVCASIRDTLLEATAARWRAIAGQGK